MKTRIQPSTLAAAASAALLATACGGGGGGGSNSSGDLTIAGTAATGTALASAAVEAKCASGNGSATTGVDGRFSITIANGARPCALRAASGASFLHSLVEAGNGASATANITPLSELITGRVAGGAPDDLFTHFDAAAQAKASAAGVASAKGDVAAGLESHVDLTGLDPLTDPLAAGNTLDQKLVALAAVLAAAGITLDDLRAVLVANAGGSPAPIEQVLQPPAASCAGLRSGRYRAVNPLETDPAFRAQVIEVDATALKVTESDGTVSTFTDTGNCTFGTPEGTVLVSRSGFGVFRSNAAPAQVSFLIPEQAIGLAELAGTWNYVSYHRTSTTQSFAPSNGYVTFDAAGKLSAHFDCVGRDTCTEISEPTDLTVNADGGFDRATAAGIRRTFAYKTAGGGITAVTLFPGQLGISVLTKQVARVLPAVGDTARSFDVTINGSGVASEIGGAGVTRTATAVDAATQSYSRVWSSDGRMDGFSINDPRTGMFYRPASVSPVNGGGNVNINEIVLLPLPGGVSVFTSVNPAQNFFGFSVGY